MRAVNLLKGSTAASARSRPGVAVIAAGAAPVLAVALVAVGYIYEHSSVTSARGKLESVQAEVAALPRHAAAPVPGGIGFELQQSQRLTALDAALSYRIAWDSTLVQIARVLPSDVWLTQMDLTSPEAADATTAAGVPNPQAFTVQGYTYSQNGVARLMTRLQLIPLLSNISLGTTSSSTLGNKPVTQFTVDAEINGPTVAAPTAAATATTTTSSS